MISKNILAKRLNGGATLQIILFVFALIVFILLLTIGLPAATQRSLVDEPPGQNGGGGANGTLNDDCQDMPSAAAAQQYISIINKYAQQYNLDPALIAAVINQESAWNPNITSPAGAIGLMQLMPGTAAGLGVTDAYNPEQNIMGGSKYLRQNMNTFNGNVDYVLAAYNAGPGAVQQYGGIPPYTETQNYVKRVKGFYQKYQKCLNATGGTLSNLPSGTRQELINKILELKNKGSINFTYIASENELNRLSDNTLKFILAAGESGNGPVSITCLTGGQHAANSYHYSGQGVDLDLNSNLQKWIYGNRDTLNIGELLGPANMTNYQVPHHDFVAGHDTHIHVGVK